MFEQKRIYIYDGAMGTMLQGCGLEPGQIPDLLSVTNPSAVAKVHQAYLDAGSDIICTNTFGANRHNLEKSPYEVGEIITAAVKLAKSVAQDKALVSLDIGPTGALLEPMGTMTFEEAYEIFKEMAMSGEKAGADCATIETMADLTEMRAAILAVKENTSLPILATMTFEKDGRTYLGTTAECFAMTAEGLGVTAVGVNCSLGPKALLETVERISKATTLPLIIKPNAGLPDRETGEYSLKSEDFLTEMEPFVTLGAGILGGCCGTNPDYIREIAGLSQTETVKFPRNHKEAQVCSSTRFVTLDSDVLLGTALLNNPEFQEALTNCDGDAVLDLVQEDLDDGATMVCYPIVDENVDDGLYILKFLQEFVHVPFLFVAKNQSSLEIMLRNYQGKACVMAEDSADMEALSIPMTKYGAVLMGL